MEKQWQQILGALILGMILPGLILRLGASRTLSGVELQQTDSITQVTEPHKSEISKIPVFTGAGGVVYMESEAYLVGVVLAEMPASFEMEALKAQAVVARTYALKRMDEGIRHPEGAVCTDPGCCQAYISPEDYQKSMGTLADILKITQAVRATAGQVVTYHGELAEATYFSCSGGRTEDAATVWGTEIPYLQAVDSPGEEQALPYSKTVRFTSAEFAAALGRSLTGSPKDWLGAMTHTEGGGVATMVVAGISYTGVQLRQLLGLNSTAFSMAVSEGEILITTLGKGHRVGMSQYGADAMAVTGSTYQEILSHYYPGTKIDKRDAMG